MAPQVRDWSAIGPRRGARFPGVILPDQRLTVTYQACDSTSCLPPSSIALELPIREAALVDRPLPAAPAKTP